jgi:hypothetical protein
LVAAGPALHDPQSTRAWARGSEGERRLAAHLLRTVGDRAVLLHDRKVPRTRGNIDHLAIAASGVWVIDAKHYTGLVLLGPEPTTRNKVPTQGGT